MTRLDRHRAGRAVGAASTRLSGAGDVRRTSSPPQARHVRTPARAMTTATQAVEVAGPADGRPVGIPDVAVGPRVPTTLPAASMIIVGPSPVSESTGASGPSRTDWRSYTDRHSSSRRVASAATTSRTNDDLPEPDTPVTTVNRPLAKSTSTPCRLWARAPRTRMASLDRRSGARLGAGPSPGAASRQPGGRSAAGVRRRGRRPGRDRCASRRRRSRRPGARRRPPCSRWPSAGRAPPRSRSRSAGWSPVVGSSSSTRSPALALVTSRASRTRWASPPDRLGRRLPERQVAEPDVLQACRGCGSPTGARRTARCASSTLQRQHIGDRPARPRRFEDLGPVPPAVAGLARDPDRRQVAAGRSRPRPSPRTPGRRPRLG